MPYTEAWTIVAGALDSERIFPDSQLPDFDTWIAQERAAAEADGLPTEVYLLNHDHENDGRECGCVQYLTDHHPYIAWNVESEG